MKKFINSAENVENEMIRGFIKAHSDKVRRLECGNVIVRSTKKENKVAVITGGGIRTPAQHRIRFCLRKSPIRLLIYIHEN